MRRVVVFVCAFFISFSTIAADIVSNNYFKTLCTVKDSVGFHWQEGEWKFTKYTKSEYLVERIPLKDYIASTKPIRSGQCSLEYQKKTAELEHLNTWTLEFGYTMGCYNVRNSSAAFDRFDSKLCVERWQKASPKWRLDRVDCDDFYFDPSGNFHRSGIPSDVTSTTENKTGMFVEHGICSKL